MQLPLSPVNPSWKSSLKEYLKTQQKSERCQKGDSLKWLWLTGLWQNYCLGKGWRNRETNLRCLMAKESSTLQTAKVLWSLLRVGVPLNLEMMALTHKELAHCPSFKCQIASCSGLALWLGRSPTWCSSPWCSPFPRSLKSWDKGAPLHRHHITSQMQNEGTLWEAIWDLLFQLLLWVLRMLKKKNY